MRLCMVQISELTHHLSELKVKLQVNNKLVSILYSNINTTIGTTHEHRYHHGLNSDSKLKTHSPSLWKKKKPFFDCT